MCCRCCQNCWEDIYWNCIEEKFCYDHTIAEYNPDDDEYLPKKRTNGFLPSNRLENNNSPIQIQPARSLNRNGSTISTKIHEEDYRQIQPNCGILAPEIMAVFASSQIFHDHQVKKSPSTMFPQVHGASKSTAARHDDSEKLLKQLEGAEPTFEQKSNPSPTKHIQFTLDDGGSDDTSEFSSQTSIVSNHQPLPAVHESDESDNQEIVLRPQFIVSDSDQSIANQSSTVSSTAKLIHTPILNKRLRNVQSLPYFTNRPASENDIFSITGSSMISMTPEIPSISYSTLPKNYEDTPAVEKYKESVSLYSMQTAQSARIAETDYSMPRYFGKADMIGHHSVDNVRMASVLNRNHTVAGRQRPPIVREPRKMEKSKRLQLLRTALPPLSIHKNRERTKD